MELSNRLNYPPSTRRVSSVLTTIVGNVAYRTPLESNCKTFEVLVLPIPWTVTLPSWQWILLPAQLTNFTNVTRKTETEVKIIVPWKWWILAHRLLNTRGNDKNIILLAGKVLVTRRPRLIRPRLKGLPRWRQPKLGPRSATNNTGLRGRQVSSTVQLFIIFIITQLSCLHRTSPFTGSLA